MARISNGRMRNAYARHIWITASLSKSFAKINGRPYLRIWETEIKDFQLCWRERANLAEQFFDALCFQHPHAQFLELCCRETGQLFRCPVR